MRAPASLSLVAVKLFAAAFAALTTSAAASDDSKVKALVDATFDAAIAAPEGAGVRQDPHTHAHTTIAIPPMH